ncbi:conserved hypothetical protein [Ricinus communis]|uniref:Uncharacterized protein n=1 Tax=Ricinus communis TaxID=3988 RepID=B9RLD7_RICCO|nr:conserved hypothetical protein [Ricinus communis]
MATQAIVPADNRLNVAFPFRIISTILSTISLIYSCLAKSNDQDPSPTSELSAIVIDSSSSSSSSSSAASSDDPRIARTLMYEGPIFRSLRNMVTSNDQLPSYHVGGSTLATSANQNHAHHQVLDPITRVFQNKEMGRHILVLTVPMVTAFLTLYSRDPNSLVASLILLLLCLGFTATWNGIMLREMYPRASNATEQIGVTLIFLAFFALVACFLPPKLAWIPLLYLALCIFPFVLMSI